MGLFAYDGNVLGGTLIGLGMASTGACPGTGLVQLGAGMGNGVLVVLGGVLGAGLFLRVRPVLLLRRRRGAGADEAGVVPPERPVSVGVSDEAMVSDTQASPPTKPPLDIPTALSIQPLTMLLLWIPMCISVIALARFLIQPPSTFPSAGIIPPAYGGLLIGVAQAATVLLTRHHIGASAAYEDLARWLGTKVSRTGGGEDASSAALITPSITFSAGIVCAVAVLKHSLLGARLALAATTLPMSVPLILRTVAGGASMVIGARLAGGKQPLAFLPHLTESTRANDTFAGCTSGHGISGLSKFSLSSLATTVAIFAGGMLSAQVLGA